ncbi:PTS sugar transporter subunit IIC [Vagococcus sp. BWB3-3]|uniref:Permease IIC component n=1 Tax=Vagococcus allomyrinae TaxID=2794353 RepID=A0A940P7X7_9ENTE|nr:PTS transporter subunit EIIC [Vagococcus allomyrinae]MBP1042710.1 PTS sugar transporter subunit IIC [Vagococcus allomyrinae]
MSYADKISTLQRRLTPFSQKIEKQRLLSSIKKGMMDLTIVLLVGSIFAMLLFLSRLNWFGAAFLSQWQDLWQFLIFSTYGMLAIYLGVSVSYHHSKHLNTPFFYSIFLSVVAVVVSHLVLSGSVNMADLKFANLLIGLAVPLLTVEVIHQAGKKKESTRLKGIPLGSRKTAYQLVISSTYLILISLLFYACRLYVVESGLIQWGWRLIAGFDTPVMIFLIVLLEMLFWFIGLNGYSILAALVLPIATNNLVLNTNLLAAGKEATHIFTPNFWDFFAGMSGSGLVGALAVLAIFSKVDSLRTKGKVAIIPSIFHISEPILYGLPIAYNPYFFIPFVIGTPLLAVCQWFVFKWGWVNVPAYHVADLPLPLAQVLATLDWRALLLVGVVFGASILMYYPFFKLYEKEVIATELAAEKDQRFDDLDLDF